MAIDLCNRLVDNELTKNELLEKVEITKTNPSDLGKICDTLSKAFGMESSDEALFQLINSRALLNESIKLVDKETGDIYGLLMFCEYPISFGSPIMIHEKGIGEYLNDFKQVNGHSFVIDERLRGTGLDKKMLFYNIKSIAKDYDLIWIAVETSLRTHAYWQRLGFTEVFSIPEAVFYMMPLNKKLLG
jgi:hypothetical protein